MPDQDASEHRFRELANSLPQTVFEMDLAGNLTFVNRSGYDMWQVTEEEVNRGVNAFDWIVPEDHESVRQNMRRVLQGEIVGSEYRARRKDGTVFPIVVHSRPIVRDGQPVGLRGMVVDLTAQKRTEQALRDSEERYRESETRYRSLVRNAAFGIYRSSVDGRFLQVNPALVSMLGYLSEAELLAVPVFALYADPRDRRILIERFMRSEHVTDVEVQWRRKDGTPVVLRLNGRWVSDDGLPEGFEMIVEDVTAQRALEGQLHHSQKMDAIGRLAGGVAHDFNNELTVILGYSELLLAEMGNDDPRRAEATEIHKAAERAAALTRRLMAFSRKQVLQPRPIDLGSVASTIEPMLRPLIGEDIELAIDAGTGLWRVKADPGQIEQVIMNLAVNARDAMPRGGKLTIGTRNVEVDADDARQHGTSPGRHVLLAVADTGSGMSAKVKAHLFEPFFTTKEHGKGTGLGLATVYGIVVQSGGHISVTSEINRGTTICLYFPAADHPAAADATAPADASTQGTGTVLIVEDEDGVRTLAATLLAGQGYRVLSAVNGEEALEVARAHPARIHVLLTDMVMPGINGYELARKMRAARPDTTVLYMSGYTEHAAISHGELKDDAGFLQKPFTRETLVEAVRKAIDSRAGGDSRQ